MSEKRIASRYAKSLIDLAVERNMLEKIFEDIRFFNATCKQNPEIENVFKSPIINLDKKQQIVSGIFKSKIDPLTASFFDIIVKKNRSNYLLAVADEFIAQYMEIKNIASATVSTANPLSDVVKAEIGKVLQKQTGKTIELASKVDKSLIGGLVVQMGDRLYDASIRTKIKNLRRELIGK